MFIISFTVNQNIIYIHQSKQRHIKQGDQNSKQKQCTVEKREKTCLLTWLYSQARSVGKHSAENDPPVTSVTGGGLLASNRLMGMCRWMGSHFHDWIDYNGVAFSIELLEWGRTFSGFRGG